MKNIFNITIGLFLALLVCNQLSAQTGIAVTPYPNKLTVKKGVADLSKGVFISGNSSQKTHLKKILNERGIVAVSEKRGVQVDLLLFPKAFDNPESYELNVSKNKIAIKATAEAGIFYGIQSLNQLLFKSPEIPLVSIKDEPAFKWRSFMLDEARYFQGKEAVKKLLDEMALLKMNRFHWHLTNDAGCRLEN